MFVPDDESTAEKKAKEETRDLMIEAWNLNTLSFATAMIDSISARVDNVCVYSKFGDDDPVFLAQSRDRDAET